MKNKIVLHYVIQGKWNIKIKLNHLKKDIRNYVKVLKIQICIKENIIITNLK